MSEALNLLGCYLMGVMLPISFVAGWFAHKRDDVNNFITREKNNTAYITERMIDIVNREGRLDDAEKAEVNNE